MEKTVKFKTTGTKRKASYDKTIFRLMGILTKLSNNEMPTVKELAEEYSVGVRTIQQDISYRLLEFPIEKTKEHKYKFIDGYSLNKTALNNDEMILLQLSLSQFREVSDFDRITTKLFNKLLKTNFINPYYIKQDDIQDIDIDSSLIERLENAIKDKVHIVLILDNQRIEVEPYKIAAFDGIWYLFAKDENDSKIKTFMLGTIKDIITLSHKHSKEHKDIEKILDKTHSAWYEDGQIFEVIVKVDPQIAVYFEQKSFLQSQKIKEKLPCGSLIISFEVTHDEDCDNLIKSWLPNIEVLEPKRFRRKIVNELQEYIRRF
jgi:predicted DNA-binding transcriptional regulator YafY